MRPWIPGGLFLFLFIAPILSAQDRTGHPEQENQDRMLANRYYDQDDYSRAYVHYQNLILQDGAGLSGEIFYRYGYSYEQIRDFDEIAMKIYALAGYYFQREGRENTDYALYAAHKLLSNPVFAHPDEPTAALLLTDLRESIDKERKAYLHEYREDLFARFFSKLSVVQWKATASIIVTIPFLIGIIVLGSKKRK